MNKDHNDLSTYHHYGKLSYQTGYLNLVRGVAIT